jgi:3-oxoadipate enol-lactonase
MALHQIDRMVVEDDGEGDVVVCLHGLGGTANTWTPLMGAVARHRVLRPELPGSGRTRVEGPLSVPAMADAVVSACARLNVKRAHFVGHSMGTIVCQHIAVAQPKLVRSLALFGPVAALADPARSAIRARAATAREGGVAAMHDIAQALLAGALSADTRARQPLAVAFVRESLQRQDPAAYARSCEALADAQAAALDRIDAETLLVTGDEDAIAPPQAVRALAAKLKNARVVVLSRCGHWTPIERPEECARELRDFLARQR